MFGHLIKEKGIMLIEDVRIIQDALAGAGMTEHDLMTILRIKSGTETAKNVKRGYLERNGDFSIIR
jgi:uncharacterized membrane protein YcaP (DUF421 family)